MKISVDQVSKKFLRHLIFKNVSLEFEAPNKYALLGANGSGKSTLLRIIAGMQSPSRGAVHYIYNNQTIKEELVFDKISFCAPGMELIEEMTLSEALNFHFNFKQLHPSFTVTSLIDIIGLSNFKDEQLGNFSSGMKQRVKLAQAIFTQSPVLLLDEPCTNLDHNGVEQYQHWITEYSDQKLVIIASNEEREYFFCKHQIKIDDYK